MSGIFGVIRRDGGAVEAADLERMRDTMAHRGPDGSQIWMEGPAGLGQLMLCSTPESLHEKLPWQDPESGFVITADARIDNRDELAAALGVSPGRAQGAFAQDAFRQDDVRHRAGTESGAADRGSFAAAPVPDSWFILEAYKRWGEACVDHLLGDFAFAIWDPRKQRLFCARDQMGARPFYYADNAGLYAFASDWEALVGLPGVSARPNEMLVATLLMPEFTNRGDRRTWQRDALALLAGETLVVARGGATQIRRYYTLQPAAAPRYASHADCVAHFLEVFGEAVRCRMRTPGPLAVMMSGGLDSAGIVAMTRRLLPEFNRAHIASYSAIDDDVASGPESRAIRSMADLPGVVANLVSVPSFTGMLSAADLTATAWSKAHPVDNAILIPTLMYLAASRNGERVMLHGMSGDVVQSTPIYYAASDIRRGHVWRAWRECRAAASNHVYLGGLSPWHHFSGCAYVAFVPAAMRRRAGEFRRRGWGGTAAPSILNPQLAEQVAAALNRDQPLGAPVDGVAETPERGTVRESITSSLACHVRVAARFGIEPRDSWADRRVVEFFLGLPVRYKVRDGWTKYLARTAFEPDLPPEVPWRRDREHLGWKCVTRLMDESQPLIDRLLSEDLPLIEDYVDVDVARATYARHRSAPDAELSDQIYGLVTLISWIKRVESLHGE